MKENPRNNTNFISYFTFGYVLPLFYKGFRRELQETDFFGTVKRCQSQVCGRRAEKSKSLFNLLLQRFLFQYIIMFCSIFIWTQTYSVLQPAAMSKLISYFEANQTKFTKTNAIVNGAIVISIKVLHTFFWSNLRVWEHYFSIEICTLLRSLIYQKILKLSKNNNPSNTNIGNIVTVVTKDLYSIENNLYVIIDLLALILETLTGAYLLWLKIGNCVFFGLGILFVSIPLQFYLSYLQTNLKLILGKNADSRLQLLQEALSSIKIVKIYTWENKFINKILEARTREIKTLVHLLYSRYIVTSLGSVTSKFTMPGLIIFYIWMGHNPNVETILYVYNIFNNLAGYFSILIPMNLANGAQMKASFMRIREILENDEVNWENVSNGSDSCVGMKNISLENGILKNVTLETEGGLTVLTGAVGSGKSSLLKVILQEIPITEGYFKVNGTISYASQEPWLYPATIKQNILFGEKYEPARYQKVIQACDLEYDLSHMEKGDEAVVLDRGQNLSKGQQARINLARAVYRKSDIYLLDDPLAALDGRVKDKIFNDCIREFLKNRIVIFVTQNKKHILQADYVLVLHKGRVISKGFPKEIESEEYQESYLESSEYSRDRFGDDKESDRLIEKERQVYHEEKNAGKVGLDVYKKYFGFGGGFWMYTLIITLYIVSEFFTSYSSKLLTHWIDKHHEVYTENDTDVKRVKQIAANFVLTKYCFLVGFDTITNLIKFYVLLIFCKNISINIHTVMSKKIIGAAMTFFDNHLIGNILNRFSLDMNNVDEHLPFILAAVLDILLRCFGSVILISTVNWYLSIPPTVVLILLLLVRWFCISTNRNLKRLEAAARSPMIGHINSTLEGLLTIRAAKAESKVKEEFYRHQDNYNSAWFTQQLSEVALNFYLEFISVLLSATVIVRFLFFPRNSSVGDVSLAITQVFHLTNIIRTGIFEWIRLETNMTSAERIIEYNEANQEDNKGIKIENWPTKGSIIFDRVFMMYGKCGEPVLKNVCFTVKSGEKIGIVGRTGAGKTSIISSLYRLYDFEGNIYIDGVDIKMLSLNYLRKNMAIIPQDPVLFTGTLRENIDPYSDFSDEKIWEAIKKVKIKNVFKLDETVCHSSFSTGQKQLICLVRAVLKNCKIVILDEATANMDPETDRMLQSVVHEVFTNCTVLTIAHRLHTIYDCDKVLIMDNGKIVEFGDPKQLANEENSHFSKMVSNKNK